MGSAGGGVDLFFPYDVPLYYHLVYQLCSEMEIPTRVLDLRLENTKSPGFGVQVHRALELFTEPLIT